MAPRFSDILELLQRQPLKDFLSTVIGDVEVGLCLYDAKGQPILREVSPAIRAEDLDEILKKPAFREWLHQVSSARPADRIDKAPDLPLYGMPLFCHDARVGVLTGWYPLESDPDRSRRDLHRIWKHLQDRLSDAYELENLSSEIVRNYTELALLYDLSSRLGALPDLDQIFRIVAEEVQSILPKRTVSILLVDEERIEIGSRLVLDEEGRTLPPYRLRLGEGITGRVVAKGTPTVVSNVREDPDFVKVPFPIVSLLSVPIAMRDRILGAINVSDKTPGKEFTTYDLKLVLAIASQAAVALENARLFDEVKDLYLSAVKSLVMAIDAKDPYTHSHSLRVSQLSVIAAETLGLSGREIEDIRLAALLHDVGKIGVPEHVLLKPGRLTEEEWKLMKQHPLHSVQILEHVKPFKHLAKWVRCEHERYDGNGYPDGLKGDEIPLPSRIIAAADAFDAITSDRCYRKRRSEEEAIEILKAHAGSQFDPVVVETFVTAFSLGKLKSPAAR